MVSIGVQPYLHALSAHAPTRSVLGRFLHSSHWPVILRSDTTATSGVRRRVVISGWLHMWLLALVSIASIVTPFGLYDTIGPAKRQTLEIFGYLHDDSPFGYGTPPRTHAPFTRVCSDLACPGQTLNQTCRSGNCTEVYDPRIPTSLRNLFNNGSTTIGSSVSGLFDIQWRTYMNASDPFSILEWYLAVAFRQLDELILGERIVAVEGLIVDTEKGGIGFRNHTAPLPSLQYGSSWAEDILFIEPETQCVDLNITLDFTLPEGVDAVEGFQDLTITDRGGLSGLSRNRPSFAASLNGQTDFDLQERAYTAAWFNNFLTLVFYNLTDPDSANISRLDIMEGATLPVPYPNISSTDSPLSCDSDNFIVAYDAIMSSMSFGGYLNFAANTSNQTTIGPKNPYGITVSNFSVISKHTSACFSFNRIAATKLWQRTSAPEPQQRALSISTAASLGALCCTVPPTVQTVAHHSSATPDRLGQFPYTAALRP